MTCFLPFSEFFRLSDWVRTNVVSVKLAAVLIVKYQEL